MSGPPSISSMLPAQPAALANQPINQPVHLSASPPVNQSVNPPITPAPVQPPNQPADQPSSQPSPSQTINTVPRLDARLIFSVLKAADEQRQKSLRQPELQQFLTLIKADTEGKVVTQNIQSDRTPLPINSLASSTRPNAPLQIQIAPSPALTTTSSADSSSSTKNKSKKTKDSKDKNERKKDKDKKKKKHHGRDSDSETGSDSDKKKKDKKRKNKDSEDSSNKKQRVSPPEPANDVQSLEEGAAAARTATAELVSNATLAQSKLATFDNELHELQAATKAKLAALSNSDEHRRLSEQAAVQARERQAAKETLDKIKKQMLQKEQVLSALRSQREELERQERAIMADKLKQSEFFLNLPTVHARFTWAANNQSLQSNLLSQSSSSTTSSSYEIPSPITQPGDRIKLKDEHVLQLACLACQTHLRNFIDSMMRVKRKRLEEPVKRAIEQSKTLHLNQPNEDMVDKIRKIELEKELYWEKQAALREAKMKGVDTAEAERAFDAAHQSLSQSTSQANLLKKRGTEPHLITVLDFAFALENDRLVNQSNAHSGRLSSIWARLPHRIKEWPPTFQPPHPITRTVNPLLNRPNFYASSNSHASPSPNSYGGSSNYPTSSSILSNRPPPSNASSNNPSPASTTQSDDLDALMDLDAGF